MVGLCVDALWMVVWLSVRTVGTVCKVDNDVQVVNFVKFSFKYQMYLLSLVLFLLFALANEDL